MKEKTKTKFTALLHLKQRVKVLDGEMKWCFEWDVFTRLFRFIRGLFPRLVKREVGSIYMTTGEGYFTVNSKGELESTKLPEIDEETEELQKVIGVSITV